MVYDIYQHFKPSFQSFGRSAMVVICLNLWRPCCQGIVFLRHLSNLGTDHLTCLRDKILQSQQSTKTNTDHPNEISEEPPTYFDEFSNLRIFCIVHEDFKGFPQPIHPRSYLQHLPHQSFQHLALLKQLTANQRYPKAMIVYTYKVIP